MSTKETEDGYLFIPDGSGALIYLDNKKGKEYQFNSRYYGGDVLVNAEIYSTTMADMTLPVYGMKVGNLAVLGIIEEGAEVATLSAYVNGSFNNVPYSRVSLNFMFNEDQTLGTFNGAITSYIMKKASTDYYSEDIKLRYRCLTGEDANYSGMARSYSEYLVEQGAFEEKAQEEEAPFFVELLGEVDKPEYFLGIPYEGTAALTTFEQAEDILLDMDKNGISNIKVEYSGMINKGINQRAAEKVKVENELGGRKSFQTLLKTAHNIGAEIYPNILLQTAYTSKGLSKKERAFFINGQVAEIYDFDLVQNKAKLSNDYPRYMISPTYLPNYLNKFIRSFHKLNINNLASDDFMTFITADYRKGNNISMTNALPYYMEALTKLSEGGSIMLSNPIMLAYPEVDYITDLPMHNSEFKVYDVAVPFQQMVLDGAIPYSSELMNEYSYDVWDKILKAIETKSALKFRFIAADTSIMEGTVVDDVFVAEYAPWKDKIGEYYKIYNEFYQKVKDAHMIQHEIIDRNPDYVVVTYSNGVKVYLNYSDTSANVKGIMIEAKNYVVQ
jgi:hypothetical protein